MKPVLLTLCLVSLATPARAEGRVSLALRFELEPSLQECPSESTFRDTVSGRLGYDPFVSDAAREIVVRVDKAGDQLIGRVDWRKSTREAQGHRSFSTKLHECSELVEDMAFAVAVQIQLLIEAEAEAENGAATKNQPEPARDPPERAESRAPPRTPNAERTPAPTPNSSGEGRLRASIGAGPSVGFGLLPSLALMGSGGIALQTRWVLLELDATASLPRTLTRTDGSGFDASLYAATANACLRRAPWFACALGRVGRLSVRGFGVDEPRTSSGWLGWLGARVGARADVLAHWALGCHLDLAGALGTRRVELDEENVWERPRLSLTTGFSTHFLFP